MRAIATYYISTEPLLGQLKLNVGHPKPQHNNGANDKPIVRDEIGLGVVSVHRFSGR